MANKVTQENIVEINEIYLKVGTYAETARRTGFAASTVKKYIIPNYVSKENISIKKFEGTPAEVDPKIFIYTENWGDLCELTSEERVELEELRKELII